MMLDGVIEIRKPEPDSQYRLKPCKICRGSNVAYVLYAAGGGDAWKAKCFDCGFTVDRGCRGRHDAQLAWNGAVV